ncbi:hypothetical protein BBK82_35495 [Lentzea guizhouensis]|uniref:Uncharacterized protein n=1 Tax=Lentzea guizhouensis TaxID=1586287 RepID=A0A1B2HS66_9PSEU|nr:hypothetical protein BBK82_35495 [Lentzea guizhouensis]
MAPPSGFASERPRRSPRAVLAGLDDVLWLGYHHLVERWRRIRLDGHVSRPVHTIDLTALDGRHRSVPVCTDQAEVHVLSLRGPLPHRSR